MKTRFAVLSFIFCSLIAVSANAQPVGWSASEPKPLSELEIPFVSDNFFLANYSPSNAVVWVDNKPTDIMIPPYSFRWVSFYVTTTTKVEARINVVTDRGTKIVRLRGQKSRTRDWRHYGWLFQLR